MKRCGKCGEVLPEEGFFRRRASRDGLQNWCKRCQREYLRGYDRFGGRKAAMPNGGDGQQYQLFPVQGNPFRVQFDLNNHNEVLNVLTMLKNRGVIRNVEF